MNVWKLLVAMILVTLVAMASPYVLASLGLIPPLKNYAWLIMIVATTGIVLKILFGDLASGQFLYYKHGYDMCMMTFGAVLSSLSLQLLSSVDMFPGISKTGPLSAFLIGNDDASQKRVLLLIMFVLTLLGTALTAYIARAIADPVTKGKDVLSMINFSIGSGFLGLYVLMLITKG